MINVKFTIENPWWNRFANIWCHSGKTPFKHTFWEIQLMKSDDIVAFDLRITTRTDHAGAELWLGLLGYAVNLHFYDNRHWDNETKDWVVYHG